MKNVAVLVGSLRKDSYNRKLFEVFRKHAPKGLNLEEVSFAELPVFNADFEEHFPESATRFKEEIEKADAVLFVSPEYNRSVPGGLKNAIDWGSRKGTNGKNSWDGKKAATVGATPGSLGTAPMQQHLRSMLVYLNMHVMGQPEFYFGRAKDRFDESGDLVDEKDEEFVKLFLTKFSEFVSQ